MCAVDELRTKTTNDMNGSIVRTKLSEMGYSDSHIDDPITTRLIYDVMKIVEDHAANSSNVIHDVSGPVCETCNGTGLVYIDAKIKNTLCPDC